MRPGAAARPGARPRRRGPWRRRLLSDSTDPSSLAPRARGRAVAAPGARGGARAPAAAVRHTARRSVAPRSVDPFVEFEYMYSTHYCVFPII